MNKLRRSNWNTPSLKQPKFFPKDFFKDTKNNRSTIESKSPFMPHKPSQETFIIRNNNYFDDQTERFLIQKPIIHLKQRSLERVPKRRQRILSAASGRPKEMLMAAAQTLEPFNVQEIINNSQFSSQPSKIIQRQRLESCSKDRHLMVSPLLFERQEIRPINNDKRNVDMMAQTFGNKDVFIKNDQCQPKQEKIIKHPFCHMFSTQDGKSTNRSGYETNRTQASYQDSMDTPSFKSNPQKNGIQSRNAVKPRIFSDQISLRNFEKSINSSLDCADNMFVDKDFKSAQEQRPIKSSRQPKPPKSERNCFYQKKRSLNRPPEVKPIVIRVTNSIQKKNQRTIIKRDQLKLTKRTDSSTMIGKENSLQQIDMKKFNQSFGRIESYSLQMRKQVIRKQVIKTSKDDI